jgi:hypothetical protein
MYAQVLESVTGWPKQGTPEELGRRERLADLLKLIVDEGDEHYHRFLAVKTALDGLSESQYLREFQAAPEPPSPDLLLCDEYYRTILTAIHVSFSQGDRAGREITREAIALMNGLDAAARRLCDAGIAPGFTLPTPWPPEGGPAQMLEGPAAEIQTLLDRITQEDPDARDLDRQRQDIVAWRERMLKLLPTLFSS